MTDFWYRYEDYREGITSTDYNGEVEVIGSRTVLRCRKFEVDRYTPKGVWLRRPFDTQRFVLNEGRKKYAHATEEEALHSFLARKQRHLSILNSQCDHVTRAMVLAQQKLNQGKTCPSILPVS